MEHLTDKIADGIDKFKDTYPIKYTVLETFYTNAIRSTTIKETTAPAVYSLFTDGMYTKLLEYINENNSLEIYSSTMLLLDIINECISEAKEENVDYYITSIVKEIYNNIMLFQISFDAEEDKKMFNKCINLFGKRISDEASFIKIQDYIIIAIYLLYNYNEEFYVNTIKKGSK
jgi:hypothetical protein